MFQMVLHGQVTAVAITRIVLHLAQGSPAVPMECQQSCIYPYLGWLHTSLRVLFGLQTATMSSNK